jgi:hypothetical protein
VVNSNGVREPYNHGIPIVHTVSLAEGEERGVYQPSSEATGVPVVVAGAEVPSTDATQAAHTN